MSNSVLVSLHPQLRVVLPHFQNLVHALKAYTYTASNRTTKTPLETPTPTTIVSRDRTSPFVTESHDIADPPVL